MAHAGRAVGGGEFGLLKGIVMKTKSRALVVLAGVIVIALALILVRRTGVSGGLKAAFDAEFLTRPDGYEGLARRYGFRFPAPPMQMDQGLMYRAISDEAVDVIDGFATDGRIPAYSLKVLEDDEHFFPPYYAAPLVRAETLKKHPELEEVLNRLAGKLPDKAMRNLNYEVDEKGRKAAEVAEEFLLGAGLVMQADEPGEGSAGTIVITGKHFTEQEILGEAMAILIERSTDLKVQRKLNLGGTMICFNALKAGDVDLYPEYTGTGLVNILKREVISDPDEAYDVVKKAFRSEYDLVLLKPFGFNNTYTLTMRRDHARQLGIETISDLANYIRTH